MRRSLVLSQSQENLYTKESALESRSWFLTGNGDSAKNDAGMRGRKVSFEKSRDKVPMEARSSVYRRRTALRERFYLGWLTRRRSCQALQLFASIKWGGYALSKMDTYTSCVRPFESPVLSKIEPFNCSLVNKKSRKLSDLGSVIKCMLWWLEFERLRSFDE